MNKRESKLLSKAILIATKAHDGQVDKAGLPYILHPLHLMNQFDDPYMKICAVLHDVVEDTDITLLDILDEFGVRVHGVIFLLTHWNDQTYWEYIESIKDSNYLEALLIKIADLEHNMNINRLNNVTQKDLDRNMKYLRAHTYLRTGIKL